MPFTGHQVSGDPGIAGLAVHAELVAMVLSSVAGMSESHWSLANAAVVSVTRWAVLVSVIFMSEPIQK
jgi:hypothetical protein